MNVPQPGSLYVHLNNGGKIAYSIGYDNDSDATVIRFKPDGSVAPAGNYTTAQDFVRISLYADGSIHSYESNGSDGSHVLLQFAPPNSNASFAFGPGNTLRHGALAFSSVTSPDGFEVRQDFDRGHLTHYLLTATDANNPVCLEASFNRNAEGGPDSPHLVVTLQNSQHDALNPIVATGDSGNFDILRLISNDGASIIGNDGASLISNDGASLISNDGASIISNDGASLITNDGGSLTNLSVADLIGKIGAGIISNDGASLISSGIDGTLSTGFQFSNGQIIDTATATDLSNLTTDLFANLTSHLGQNQHLYLGPSDDAGDFGSKAGGAQLLSEGKPRTGQLASEGDSNWYRVDLVAGTTYVFDLNGRSSGDGTLADPFLHLLNSAGAIIAHEDDGGLGTNSRLVFTPASNGTFYLVARGFDDAWAGTYSIEMSVGSASPKIESNGGGDNASITVRESTNSSDSGIVTKVEGWDLVDGNTLSYSIVGGTDADKFYLNPTNGFLSFKILPDFENPRDSNHDNVFEVAVRATDADGNFDTQTLTIRVTNAIEPIYGTHDGDTIDATHPGATGGAPTSNADWIFGLAGNDRINAGGGNDSIQGGPGDDIIVGGAGNLDTAIFVGNASEYTITRDLLTDTIIVTGPDGTDTLSGVERLAFDDTTLVVQIQGTTGNDVLNGSNGDDVLAPLTGSHDEVYGYGGYDRLSLDFSNVNLAVSFVTNTVHSPGGDSVYTYVVAGNFGDAGSDEVLYSSIEAFSIRGSLTRANNLRGGALSDVFVGGTMGDIFDTGAGNDIVDVGKGGATDTGSDRADMGSGGSDLLIANYSAATVAVTFSIYSNSSSVGGLATDYYSDGPNGAQYVGAGRLTFSGVERFSVTTGSANDSITTGDGADTLSGGGGNDLLNSGRGKATIDGGSGVDQWKADLSLLGSGVTINLTSPATVQTLADGSTIRNVERLDLTATNKADTITLGAAFSGYANSVSTLLGNDTVTIRGGASAATSGVNTVDLGAGGSDLLIADYSAATAAVTFSIYSNSGSVGGLATDYYSDGPNGAQYAGAGRLTFSGVERFSVTTGSANDSITTGDGADTLSGGGGNDLLNSGRGKATIDGGSGVDQWKADLSLLGSGATINLTSPATVQTLADGSAIRNVERLDLTATNKADTITLGAAFSGYANSVSTLLGNDTVTIRGGASAATSGVNTVDLGAGGNDLLIADYSAATVAVTFSIYSNSSSVGGLATDYYSDGPNGAQYAGVGRLTFSGVERFSVTTGSANDSITTGDGADTLSGGGGNDLLSSGRGNDILVGGSGADTMSGGAGNDTYYVDNAGDTVLEAVGGGSDQVLTSVSYTLTAGARIELFTTTAAAATGAINLTGNEFGQAIQGNAGANIIDGKAGADTMSGFGGNDRYFVDNAGDKVLEAVGGGSDRVLTSVSYTLTAGAEIELFTTTTAAATGAINLTGNEFGQTIQGNAGANIIDGKAGADTMQGFGGIDTFVFSTALGADNIDTIADFSVADDTIRLAHAIFDGLGTNHVLDAAAFHIGAAATNTSQRIIYDSATGNLYFDDDGSGTHAPRQFAHLSAGLALTNADFFVA